MNHNKTRMITGCALLIAVAVILQYIEISIPLMPSFIKLDFSDLPELIGSFMYGPIAGILICGIKNLLHIFVSQSGFVGELSNFLLGSVFVGVAGALYKRNKTKKNAFYSGIIGAVCMGLISLPVNYFIIYPMYYTILGFPEVAVLSMYQVINPHISNMVEALITFNMPFTVVKGLINVVICMLIYKRLSIVLKGDLTNK